MAKKKKTPKLSAAQRRAYLRGLRRGKTLSAEALTRKRKAAARKAAETRKQRSKREKPPTIGEVVPELVLYEASADEAAPVFAPLPEWPVLPAEWAVTVQLILEGRVIEEAVIPVPAEWEAEAVGRTIRRQVRAWLDEARGRHEGLRESPQAAAVRLSLRNTLA